MTVTIHLPRHAPNACLLEIAAGDTLEAVLFAIVRIREQLGDPNTETALMVVSYLAVSRPCLPSDLFRTWPGWCRGFVTKPIAKAGQKALNGIGPEGPKGSLRLP